MTEYCPVCTKPGGLHRHCEPKALEMGVHPMVPAKPLFPAQAKADADKAEEHERMRALGMTDAEARLWYLVGEVARGFNRLPVQHPENWPEAVPHIHHLQDALLIRPTYRAYLGPEAFDETGRATIWDEEDQ